MTGVGVSLGASLLANMAARKGKKNPMTACVGVGCHFDEKCFAFLKHRWFGWNDFVLGQGIIAACRKSFEEYDKLVSLPEQKIGEELKQVWTLTGGFPKLQCKTGGYTAEEY